MTKLILLHLYVIVMSIFVVMAGNILAERYGPTISSNISAAVNSADSTINNVQDSVVDWNRKILE